MKKIKDLLLVFFFFLTYLNANSQTNNDYSVMSSNYSACDISRMITNKMNQSRDWPKLLDESINEYLLLLKGTNIIKDFKNIDTLTYKIAFFNTFPEFYGDMFTSVLCNSTVDRKFLAIWFKNVMDYHLTKDEIEYYTIIFDDNFVDLLHDNKRVYMKNNLPNYLKKWVSEYKKISQTKKNN